jgi:hypothetical protein
VKRWASLVAQRPAVQRAMAAAAMRAARSEQGSPFTSSESADRFFGRGAFAKRWPSATHSPKADNIYETLTPPGRELP